MLLVTGAQGQLSTALKKFFTSVDAIFATHQDLDITDPNRIDRFLETHKISAILNAAAWTDVDRAEENPDACRAVNVEGVVHLAEQAGRKNLPMIHLSSDYVFDGQKTQPYREDDLPRPLSIYGKSKYEGEQEFLRLPGRGAIIRTSAVYSEWKENFVTKIFSAAKNNVCLEVTQTPISSPTYVVDLAEALYHLLPKLAQQQKEVFHFANAGFCSRLDWAREILRIKNISVPIKEATLVQKNGVAQRPKFSALDCHKIMERFNYSIRPWQEALTICLEKLS